MTIEDGFKFGVGFISACIVFGFAGWLISKIDDKIKVWKRHQKFKRQYFETWGTPLPPLKKAGK